jgi:hypothetical protein
MMKSRTMTMTYSLKTSYKNLLLTFLCTGFFLSLFSINLLQANDSTILPIDDTQQDDTITLPIESSLGERLENSDDPQKTQKSLIQKNRKTYSSKAQKRSCLNEHGESVSPCSCTKEDGVTTQDDCDCEDCNCECDCDGECEDGECACESCVGDDCLSPQER